MLAVFLVACDGNQDENSKGIASEEEKIIEVSKEENSLKDIPEVSTVGNITYQLKNMHQLDKSLAAELELEEKEGFIYWVVAIDYEVKKKSTSTKEDGFLRMLNSTEDHSISSIFLNTSAEEKLYDFYQQQKNYLFNLSPGTVGTNYDIFELNEKIASENYEWYISFVTPVGYNEKGKMYVGDLQP